MTAAARPDLPRGARGRVLVRTVLLVGVLLLAACDEAPPDLSGPAELQGIWELTAGQGPAGEVQTDDPITLEIDGTSWGGTAACNQYGTDAEVRGDEVVLGDVFNTDIFCPGRMDAEEAYLTAFRAVDGLTVDADRLTLTGPDVELTYGPLGGPS